MMLRILAAALFVITASSANALPTVRIVWDKGCGATCPSELNTANATVGEEVTAYVVLDGDATSPPVTGVFVTVAFDNEKLTALSGGELATVNLPGMGNEFAPLTLGVNIFQAEGDIRNFDTSTLATGLATDVSRTLGSLVFRIEQFTNTADNDDGAVANLSNTGLDAITGPGNANFVAATVVPEPSAALIGGASLLTLLGLKRRRDRS